MQLLQREIQPLPARTPNLHFKTENAHGWAFKCQQTMEVTWTNWKVSRLSPGCSSVKECWAQPPPPAYSSGDHFRCSEKVVGTAHQASGATCPLVVQRMCMKPPNWSVLWLTDYRTCSIELHASAWFTTRWQARDFLAPMSYAILPKSLNRKRNRSAKTLLRQGE